MRIRYKIIWAYIASAILSGVCCVVLSVVCLLVMNTRIYGLIGWLGSHIIAIPIIFIIIVLFFFILMSVFFLGLTRNGIKYLEEITKALRGISTGEFNTRISIKTKDELGELAKIINDMTMKLDTLIKEEQNWKQTNRELITNISHDLRTPLTSILGYVELISRDQNPDKQKNQHYAEILSEKCEQVKVLIDDLLEYSQLSSKELTINAVTVNLEELLEQVIIGFIPIFEKEEMEYRIITQKTKISVSADPVLLARLFDNLIGNAVRYGNEGKFIEVEIFEETHEAVVRIINYGEEIPEEDLPLIFDRYYRSEKSKPSDKGGKGLGLAIVKKIVDIHGGKVKAFTENGKTIFEVRLKLLENQSAEDL